MKCVVTIFALGIAAISATAATLHIDASRVVREMDRHKLLGVNAALYNETRQLLDTDLRNYLLDLKPAYVRIPGGSWSDEYVWNGNGVWDGNKFDQSKWANGKWQIDWSGYAPGFRQVEPGRPDSWHGNLDVLALHEFAKDKGAGAMVTVNVGSGTAEMAAEWVRWANQKMGYGVKYWEIGNELEGSWEMGNTLPDGSKMTGEIYAKKFIEYAKAMKSVDPTIRVGGPAAANSRAVFAEDLLRLAGQQVDFLSFHTYPVDNNRVEENFVMEQAYSLRAPMEKLRQLVAKYQPARKDAIEIGITEWNSKVLEDRVSGDLLNGLWSAIYVGEMMRQGVSFAMQWDLLTQKGEGGHGMFQFVGGRCLPKSQYWGLYLWSKYMGDQLIAADLTGATNVHAIVTRDPGRLFVMLLNLSREQAAEITVEAPGISFAETGCMATLSHREYFWDFLAHKPRWSRPPTEEKFALSGKLSVPPYSLRVFELPLQGRSLRTDAGTDAATSSAPLEIVLPKSAPADLPIEGWVLLNHAVAKDGKQFDHATLAVDGPAKSSAAGVSLSESAGRFFLNPSGAGTVTVRAAAGGVSAEQAIEIVAVQERKEIVWQFEDAPEKWSATTSYKLTADDTVRPNQKVASVILASALPEEGSDKLAVFSLPTTLPKERIAGVVLDVSASADFACADKNVGVRVVLQSEMDHWIELGTVKLQEVRGQWRTREFKLDASKYPAMGKTYALFIQLYQDDAKKVPVTGNVYLDNAGFILR
jgi:alpha-L-arabinofuranosidase